MKRISLIAVIILIGNLAYGQAHWNNSSFVHRSGRHILDGTGTAIKLDGVNLGGWLSWEAWEWGGYGTGFNSESTIYNNLSSILGGAYASNFRDSVYKNYITSQDINQISKTCFNVVRIPFNHLLLEDDSLPFVYKASGWAVLDSALQWCENNNVYAVLDLHAAPGGQANVFTADPDPILLWASDTDQLRTTSMWKAIANRYKNRGIVAGYDLLNEPAPPTDSALLAIYRMIIDSIRTVDPNHMLFLEGSSSATNYAMFTTPLPDNNITFEFHFYTYFISNIAGSLLEVPYQSFRLNAPVWCGEWGQNNYQQLDSTVLLLRDSTYGISGQCMWTWKKAQKLNQDPYYWGIDSTYDWNVAITWLTDTTRPRPSGAQVMSGVDSFLRNIRFANCVLNDSINTLVTDCKPPLGISPLSGYSAITLSPNPTSGILNIQAMDDQELSKVVVYDLLGKMVAEFPFSNQINIAQLLNGLYLIRIVNKNDSVIYTSKITLQY